MRKKKKAQPQTPSLVNISPRRCRKSCHLPKRWMSFKKKIRTVLPREVSASETDRISCETGLPLRAVLLEHRPTTFRSVRARHRHPDVSPPPPGSRLSYKFQGAITAPSSPRTLQSSPCCPAQSALSLASVGLLLPVSLLRPAACSSFFPSARKAVLATRGFTKTRACCSLRGGASAVRPTVCTLCRRTALGSVSLAARRCAACFDILDPQLRCQVPRPQEKLLQGASRYRKKSSHLTHGY